MNKKIIILIFWVAVVGATCAIFFFGGVLSWKGKTKLPAPRPDAIETSAASNTTMLIANKTAGYTLTVPQNWYLEKSSGSGVVVYPDYDAAGKMPPDCKIEISTLPDPDSKGLADWLTAYLHEDPTADVTEVSRTTGTVSGVPMIVWRGALNGVSSTLAYVATGTKVYEIAPSRIAPDTGGTADADCANVLQTLLANFQFIK
jgi:hypothetical protein